MKSRFMTVQDVIQELGISRTTAYQIVRQIKHSKVGRRILIAEEDLLEYLHHNSQVRDNTNQTQNNNM